jgi:hypothetical protein
MAPDTGTLKFKGPSRHIKIPSIAARAGSARDRVFTGPKTFHKMNNPDTFDLKLR